MKVLIAGGGTGGHIYPGVAIAKFIKQKHPDSEIVFVGTQKGLETKLIPREGFELKLITVRGFKRKLSVDTLVAVKELFQGLLEARKIIKEFSPDVVIGTGGYVCGPVVFSATRMRIPTVIHEQNAFPGVTNRILSRVTEAVAISFKESKKFFKSAKKLVHTGNPVRDEMLRVDKNEARQKLGIPNDKQLVVVFGGSRGAGKINETVAELIQKYYKDGDCKIIFATGEAQFEKISKQLSDIKTSNIEVTPYIYDMSNIMAAADLAICRAGAITISELQVLGTPSIMIPSPNVTANHQEFNARALEQEGGAVVILEKNLNAELLHHQMMDLLKDKEQLSKMSRNAKKTGVTNATEKIYSIVRELSNM
ncbi:MAG: undecaprenyldiphospho-muramoylpentapeptide beta-N-acetylglucosaminyltransferase [Clostridia bacterium]|nr:undecaprenyldiphospho-muramoylpentapeptide beta-N-acetylglucosaminyltransferase [Clostridia bacterium]